MNTLDMFKLNGKTALVTGCRRGIGLAMAVSLAEAGADIVGVSATLAPEGEEVARQVRDAGRTFRGYACDFSDRSCRTISSPRSNATCRRSTSSSITPAPFFASPPLSIPTNTGTKLSKPTSARILLSRESSAKRCSLGAAAKSSSPRRCSAFRAGSPSPVMPPPRVGSRRWSKPSPTSGPAKASTSTRLRPAISAPTIPKPCETIRPEAPRSWPASPPTAGANPKISKARPFSSHPPPRIMCTEPFCSWMVAGWAGESSEGKPTR